MLNASCSSSTLRNQCCYGLRVHSSAHNAKAQRVKKLPKAVADSSKPESRVELRDRLVRSQVVQLEKAPSISESDPQVGEHQLGNSTASVSWLLSGSQPRHSLRDALSRSPSVPGGKAGVASMTGTTKAVFSRFLCNLACHSPAPSM
jgi:hypothetical protein